MKQQGMIHFSEWSAELGELSASPSVCALARIPEVCSTSGLPWTPAPPTQQGEHCLQAAGDAGQSQALLQDSSAHRAGSHVGHAPR